MARDRTELDAIVDRLRDGRRAVAFVVCPPDLCDAAREYVVRQSRREVPAPERVSEVGRMLELLNATAGATPASLLSVRLDPDATEALEVLNEYRDNLRRGASVLLWLDDEQALSAVRHLAPDAFSFRDVVVGVVGEGDEQIVSREPDDLDVQLAEARYRAATTPVERAWEAAVLAGRLDLRGRNDEALAVLQEALWALSWFQEDSETRLARARLHGAHAQAQVRQRLIDAAHHIQAGLAALARETGEEADEERVWLWSGMVTPLGVAAAAGEELARLERPEGMGQSVLVSIALRTSELYAQRGRLREAALRLEKCDGLAHLSEHNRAALLAARARVASEAGDLPRAAELLREAAALVGPSAPESPDLRLALSEHARLQGDLAAARALLADRPARPAESIPPPAPSLEITLDEGDVEAALPAFEAAIKQAASRRNDRPLHHLSRAFTAALREAREADRLSSTALARGVDALTSAGAVAASMCDEDFQWYRVLFPAMRAEVLAWCADRHAEAIPLLQDAWKLACNRWPEAAPPQARALVHVLLAAGRAEEAARVLDGAVPDAAAQRDLRELSRLLAARAALLARTQAGPAACRDAMAELRTVLGETSSPRITAATLLELARLLPADGADLDPDPLPLLEEAAALFARMPIPAQQSRCLELAGDVLAARHRPAEAALRHAEALAILTRHGLGLRIPLLRRKAGAPPP